MPWAGLAGAGSGLSRVAAVSRGLTVVRVVTAACLVAVLSACGGGGSAPASLATMPSGEASGSASPTPSPTPTVVLPVLPEAAKKPTREGAVAFVEYFWELYNYGFATGDPAAVDSVSDPGCIFCQSTQESLESLSRRKLVNEGGAVTVVVAVAAPGKPEEGMLVNTTLDQEASHLVSPEGAITDVSAATTNDRSDAAVIWEEGSWHVLEIDVMEPGERS
jgi:hypothetical protein